MTGRNPLNLPPLSLHSDIPASPTPRTHQHGADADTGGSSSGRGRLDLPKFRPGYRRLMADARRLVETNDPSMASALMWKLDDATGIIASDPPVGTTLTSASGCKVLPVAFVRGVEYEYLARAVNWTEMEITQMKTLLPDVYHHHQRYDDRPVGDDDGDDDGDDEKEKKKYGNKLPRRKRPGDIYVGQVRDLACATDYLTRATITRNRYARRLLNWLKPHMTMTSVLQSPVHVARGFVEAVKQRDRERAIKLGRMIEAWDGGQWWIHHDRKYNNNFSATTTGDTAHDFMNRGGFGDTGHTRAVEQYQDGLDKRVRMQVRPDATMVLGMKPREQKAMAANNIAFLLHHGNEQHEIERDINEAVRYYEMAVAWGSASAACNLAHLYHHEYGLGKKALGYYELALERGERNFTPRNIAQLLQNGTHDLPPNTVQAAYWLVIGIAQGDAQARMKCRTSLKHLTTSLRYRFLAPPDVKRQCERVLCEPDHVLEQSGSGML